MLYIVEEQPLLVVWLSQNVVCLLGCQNTLLSHAEPTVISIPISLSDESSPATHLTGCIFAHHYTIPGAEPGIFLC